jgi:lipoate-protein ligase A
MRIIIWRVIEAVAAAMEMERDALLASRGWRRHALMDALLRHAALSGTEVARLLDVSPSTVSVGRKRLTQRQDDHPRIAAALADIAQRLKS